MRVNVTVIFYHYVNVTVTFYSRTICHCHILYKNKLSPSLIIQKQSVNVPFFLKSSEKVQCIYVKHVLVVKT